MTNFGKPGVREFAVRDELYTFNDLAVDFIAFVNNPDQRGKWVALPDGLKLTKDDDGTVRGVEWECGQDVNDESWWVRRVWGDE